MSEWERTTAQEKEALGVKAPPQPLKKSNPVYVLAHDPAFYPKQSTVKPWSAIKLSSDAYKISVLLEYKDGCPVTTGTILDVERGYSKSFEDRRLGHSPQRLFEHLLSLTDSLCEQFTAPPKPPKKKEKKES